MAIRVEELRVGQPSARIYRFPSQRARRRAMVVRRRITLGAVLVVAVIAFVFATGPAGVAPASESWAPRAVVVHSGQTLWDVADRYSRPGTDSRAYVQAILDLNHLDAPPAVGVRIRLPR